MVKEHVLKSEVDYFGALWRKMRAFEIRRNDRAFAVGDRCRFKEYDRQNDVFTGREEIRIITFVLPADERLGLKAGYCGLGLTEESVPKP